MDQSPKTPETPEPVFRTPSPQADAVPTSSVELSAVRRGLERLHIDDDSFVSEEEPSLILEESSDQSFTLDETTMEGPVVLPPILEVDESDLSEVRINVQGAMERKSAVISKGVTELEGTSYVDSTNIVEEDSTNADTENSFSIITEVARAENTSSRDTKVGDSSCFNQSNAVGKKDVEGTTEDSSASSGTEIVEVISRAPTEKSPEVVAYIQAPVEKPSEVMANIQALVEKSSEVGGGKNLPQASTSSVVVAENSDAPVEESSEVEDKISKPPSEKSSAAKNSLSDQARAKPEEETAASGVNFKRSYEANISEEENNARQTIVVRTTNESTVYPVVDSAVNAERRQCISNLESTILLDDSVIEMDKFGEMNDSVTIIGVKVCENSNTEAAKAQNGSTNIVPENSNVDEPVATVVTEVKNPSICTDTDDTQSALSSSSLDPLFYEAQSDSRCNSRAETSQSNLSVMSESVETDISFSEAGENNAKIISGTVDSSSTNNREGISGADFDSRVISSTKIMTGANEDGSLGRNDKKSDDSNDKGSADLLVTPIVCETNTSSVTVESELPAEESRAVASNSVSQNDNIPIHEKKRNPEGGQIVDATSLVKNEHMGPLSLVISPPTPTLAKEEREITNVASVGQIEYHKKGRLPSDGAHSASEETQSKPNYSIDERTTADNIAQVVTVQEGNTTALSATEPKECASAIITTEMICEDRAPTLSTNLVERDCSKSDDFKEANDLNANAPQCTAIQENVAISVGGQRAENVEDSKFVLKDQKAENSHSAVIPLRRLDAGKVENKQEVLRDGSGSNFDNPQSDASRLPTENIDNSKIVNEGNSESATKEVADASKSEDALNEEAVPGREGNLEALHVDVGNEGNVDNPEDLGERRLETISPFSSDEPENPEKIALIHPVAENVENPFLPRVVDVEGPLFNTNPRITGKIEFGVNATIEGLDDMLGRMNSKVQQIQRTSMRNREILNAREEARKQQSEDESSPPSRSPPAERVSSNESRPSPKNENLDGPAAERTSNAASEEIVIQSDDAHGPSEFEIPKKQEAHPTEALVEEGTASTTVPSKQHDTKSDECKEDAVIQQNEKIDVGETSSSLGVESKDQSGESDDNHGESSSSSSNVKSSIPDSEPKTMSSEGATGLDRSRAMELFDLTPTELDSAMFSDTNLDLFYSSPNYTAEEDARAVDAMMSTLRRTSMAYENAKTATIEKDEFDFLDIPSESNTRKPRNSLYLKFDPLWSDSPRPKQVAAVVPIVTGKPPESENVLLAQIAELKKKIEASKEVERVQKLEYAEKTKEMEVAYEKELRKLDEANLRVEALDKKVKAQDAKNTKLYKEVEERQLAFINACLLKKNLLKVHEEHLVELEKENLEIMKQLTNAETSFASLHNKYEALKSILNSLNVNKVKLDAKINELKEACDDLECKIQEENSSFDSKIARIREEMKAGQEEHGAKASRIRAQIRKIELKVETLTAEVEQRIKENAELTTICDKLSKGDK